MPANDPCVRCGHLRSEHNGSLTKDSCDDWSCSCTRYVPQDKEEFVKAFTEALKSPTTPRERAAAGGRGEDAPETRAARRGRDRDRPTGRQRKDGQAERLGARQRQGSPRQRQRTRFDALAEELEEPKKKPYVSIVGIGPVLLMEYRFDTRNNYDGRSAGFSMRELISVVTKVEFKVAGVWQLDDFRGAVIVLPDVTPSAPIEPIRTWIQKTARGDEHTEVEAIVPNL